MSYGHITLTFDPFHPLHHSSPFHPGVVNFIGVVLMVVGLGLTATAVMLPAGIVLGLLGALIFVGGIFAPVGPTARPVH